MIILMTRKLVQILFFPFIVFISTHSYDWWINFSNVSISSFLEASNLSNKLGFQIS